MKLVHRSSLPVILANGSHAVVDVPTAVNVPPNDDDLSLSSEHSTISVRKEAPHDKAFDCQPCLAPRRRRCRGGTVHFHDDATVYYDNTTFLYQDDDCQALWYSAAELKCFKQQTVTLAKDIYRMEKQHADEITSYSHVVAAAYQACCHAPCEMETSPLTVAQQEQLQQCMVVQSGVRRHGLERLCVRSVATDKRARRQSLVQAVLNLQESLVTTRYDTIDEVLCHLSMSISRPSRLFAQQVAQAQATL